MNILILDITTYCLLLVIREDQNNFNKMKWLIWIHQSNDNSFKPKTILNVDLMFKIILYLQELLSGINKLQHILSSKHDQ